MVTITETFHPQIKNAWREWLSKNHTEKSEIWLVFYKKSTGKQIMTYQEAVDEALCFGWIDGIEKRINDEMYALRFTPRKEKSNWSETNKKRYQSLCEAGQMTQAGTIAFEKNAKKP